MSSTCNAHDARHAHNVTNSRGVQARPSGIKDIPNISIRRASHPHQAGPSATLDWPHVKQGHTSCTRWAWSNINVSNRATGPPCATFPVRGTSAHFGTRMNGCGANFGRKLFCKLHPMWLLVPRRCSCECDTASFPWTHAFHSSGQHAIALLPWHWILLCSPSVR